MKLCRFDEFRIGLIRGRDVLDITPFVQSHVSEGGLRPAADILLRALPFLHSLGDELERIPRAPLASVRLLSPILAPGKIIAAPDNYRAHAAEMRANPPANSRRPSSDLKEAGLFLKATTSLVGPSQGIERRFPERRTDYEVELVAVIGKEGSGISRHEALNHIAGYSIGLDITTRGPEDRSFRKSSDTYTVLGPCIVTSDELADPQNVELELYKNDDLRQRTSTSDMIHDVAALVEYASTFYTLYPGDLLFTGTPSGVGPIEAGDRLRACAAGIGMMEVAVRDRPAV